MDSTFRENDASTTRKISRAYQEGEMTEEYVLKDTGKLGILNFKPNYNIYFHRGNEKVGVLDFNGPEMKFSGDMDESAKLFLEFVATSFKARLEQERAVGYREGHMAALSQRTWVGLTDEEVDECYYWKGRQWTTDELVRHVEAKLREKNNG